MPEKQTAWLMSAGASLMFIAGCFHLLFRAAPSIFSSGSQASVAADNSTDEDDSCADTTELAMAMTAWKQTQQGGSRSGASSPAETAPVGGDIAPARSVADAYASLHSVAVDPDANQVMVSDSNRGAIFFYDRSAGGNSSKIVSPNRVIRGPRTGMMFVAGISLDTADREVFAVNNDIGDRME